MPGQTAKASTAPAICDLSLEEIELVDCDAPEAFEALTRLAQRLFGVPVALISIVEEARDRQFFLSQQGLGPEWAAKRRTPLSHSFCKHVKTSGRPLQVSDARVHPLVRDNLAIRDLGVVAYLGVPIRKPDGDVIGALCVIEDEPRTWEEGDLLALQDLACCVNDEITLRASMAETRARHARTLRYNALREAVMLSFVAPDIAIEDRFSELLKMSCEALDFEAGLIARIDADSCETEFVHHRVEQEAKSVANPLSGSFSAFVVSGQRQVVLHDVVTSEHVGRHTLTGSMPGCYVGLPLIFDGTIYGTLELFSARARAVPFSDEEESIFGLMSMFVCAHLGIFEKIKRLQNSESNLMNFLIEAQHSGLSRATFREAPEEFHAAPIASMAYASKGM